MDLIARYRNVALLITALVAQLVLLGYHVRGDDGSPLLQTWAIGLAAPINNLLTEGADDGSSLWRNYVWLVGAREENERMRREIDRLRLEKREIERKLERLDRSAKLLDYKETSPSKTVASEVIGGGGGNLSEALLNRGREDGIEPGMAVITADGIVGEVKAAHDAAALVVLINDRNAAVGAILGGSRVHGIMEGLGGAECELRYVAHEVDVKVGETVYTSGEDRIFPKGLPIGKVSRLADGNEFRKIYVRPFAKLDRLDEVLVITEGTHLNLPDTPQPPASLLPPPGGELTQAPAETPADQVKDADQTDADRIKRRYQELGEAQGHTFGEGLPGSRPPNFNLGLTDPEAEEDSEAAPPDHGPTANPDAVEAAEAPEAHAP